ncbi:aromatic ring-hydroxylating oxygenase subunit alpha [Rubrimonas cliftonensis]|uniref:Rieske 2Fe-2S family protein n=1 Tax=Rubrimonas cliftonensis TaxID=89524 RepID=A0A1H4DZ78_9RHOB|nr:aromatic ring-hydroxylating dioxygenase subunit alpha [Rubrimonas cliftonensis]SEA78061.1 Rieske 2Fe-2S family protein [Rubrimonas cliftonensis]
MLDASAPLASSISDLLRLRTPNHTLPAPLYTGQAAFDADMQAIFHGEWICVGVSGDAPEEGDVYVVDVGRTSVAIVRDDDMGLRAFHNVCRHRGARLLPAGRSTVGKLVCPYHQWTYELTGELIDAPHMGSAFDRATHNLKPVHLRAIEGLLFICLADAAPADIEEIAAILGPRLAPYGLADAKVAHETELVELGNWKLTMENNRECYHCAGNHPELSATFVSADFGYDPQALSAEDLAAAEAHNARFCATTEAWEAEGWPSRMVDRTRGFATMLRTQRLIMGSGGESQTPDGKIACTKLMGSMDRLDLGDTHAWMSNMWSHFMADHGLLFLVFPLSPDRTLVRTKWLVNRDAREGLDYQLDRLTAVWIATNAQDAHLVALAHQGALDAGYVPGPYSTFTETTLDDYITWYVERMQAHGW